MKLIPLMSAAALLGCLASAQAEEFKAGPLTIDTPWARASAVMAGAAGAFLVVHNSGDADKLIGVKSDVAKDIMIHTSYKDGEVMKMRKVDGVDVPAHGDAVLAPGGYHIMLIGLKAPLKEGETFPMTLTFQKAGEVPVTVAVQKAGAVMGGAGMPSDHMSEHHQ